MAIVETNDLSERELDILKLVATGASNKEIAQKLFISSNTVKVHLRNIFSKIGANSRTEAAMYAVRIGLVENASPRITIQEEPEKSVETSEFPTDEKENSHEAQAAPKLSKKQHLIRLAGLSIILIVIIILGSMYLPKVIIQADIPVPNTPTPRVQWFELPGLPTPRKGLAVVSYENVIYAIGGETADGIANAIEKYDPKTNLWTSLSQKPTPVTDINAALIGGLIYIPGGRLSSGLPTDKTEVYDPRSDDWTNGINLPKPLSAYSLAVYEGKMYIFGGWDGQKTTNNVFVFDPHDNTWTEATPMPTARSSSGAVVVGGKINVIGGWDGVRALTVNEVFHPDLVNIEKQWTDAASLPSGRYAMGVSNVADMVFVIGGTSSADDLKTIALLQGATEWSKLDSPVYAGWTDLNAVAIGSRLYALGGSTEEGLINQMWSYQAFYTITLPIIR